MAERTRNPGDTAVAIPKARTAKKVAKPPLFKVLLHNDDFTTMEFVVEVLQTVFHHDIVGATRIMLHIHQRGVGVAGTYSMEIAETKAEKVMSMAREAEYPLLCTVEPE
ncbi:MAG TPA: ATP-dependent Clp protease adaptor ClpS [Anaeromyxobacteraceae bacterium]